MRDIFSKRTKREHLKHYRIKEENLIGQGSQANVYRGYDIRRGCQVAVKVFHDAKAPWIEKEVNALKLIKKAGLKHSLQFVDSFEKNGKYYLVTELVDGIELHDLVVEGIPEATAKSLFRKILLAVNELHQIGICHLDLKLENIMYSQKTGEIKLIDFGFSEQFSIPNFPGGEKLLEKFCGSVHYTCPEIGRHQAYRGTRADIWALGVILYTMLEGEFPFYSDSNIPMEILVKIQRFEMSIPSWFGPSLMNFLLNMLTPGHDEHCSIPQLLNHPWVSI